MERAGYSFSTGGVMYNTSLIIKIIWYIIVGKLKLVYPKVQIERLNYCRYYCPKEYCLSKLFYKLECTKCPSNYWNLCKF